jgi:hypothetical protein
MPVDQGVLGSFSGPEAAARAVRALKAGGFDDVRAAMPAPFSEVVAALGKPRSAIDFVTFPGALLGLLCGIGLTVGTSIAWPIVTGGKPIVSIPPFVIVIFEVTVLIGSLTNLAALSLGTWHGGRLRFFPSRAQFNADRIGVFAAGADPVVAERILRESGAQEVSRVR